VSPVGTDVVAEDRSASEPPRDGREAWAWFGRARWLLVLAGLLSGLAAFAIGEFTHDLIPTEKVKQNLMGSIVMAPDRTTTAVAWTRNGAITFGVLGLCLGAGLGVAGGLARRTRSGAVAGGLVGSVLGAALGAGVSFALLPLFIDAQFLHFEYDLQISMAMHGLLWGLLGAVGGLAVAVGMSDYGRSAQALLAGLVGSVLGSVAYDIMGAVLFSGADTDEPISETWPTRLLASLLVTIGAAVAVALSLPEPRPAEPEPRKESPPSAPPAG
jgi:hypothetical protein